MLRQISAGAKTKLPVVALPPSVRPSSRPSVWRGRPSDVRRQQDLINSCQPAPPPPPRAAAPLTSKTPAKTEREGERGSKEKGEGDDVRKMSTSFPSRGGEEGKNEDAVRPSCN